jgi:hypothetical protein
MEQAIDVTVLAELYAITKQPPTIPLTNTAAASKQQGCS